jgi:hypothetical protein
VKDGRVNPFALAFSAKDCSAQPDPCGHAQNQKFSKKKFQIPKPKNMEFGI